MIKYIIAWCLISTFNILCDWPHKDEFGRTVQNFYALGCTRTERHCGFKKEFTNKDETYAFYLKGKSETETIDSLKIDSIKIN